MRTSTSLRLSVGRILNMPELVHVLRRRVAEPQSFVPPARGRSEPLALFPSRNARAWINEVPLSPSKSTINQGQARNIQRGKNEVRPC
jgi:hypothetical protein